jgi:hypothetical protein
MMEQQNKWISMHWRMHKIFERVSKGEVVLKSDKPIDKDWLSKVHRFAVDNMCKDHVKHVMVDGLDRTLPAYLINASIQKNVLWGDVFLREKEFLVRALTTQNADALIPRKIAKNTVQWAFYVTPPHGTYIWNGTKTLIIKSMVFKHHIGEPLLLISGDYAYGIISLGEAMGITQQDFNSLSEKHRIGQDEARKLGFDRRKDLYMYKINSLHTYPQRVRIEKPKGMQTFARISEIRVPNGEHKSVEFGEKEMDNMFFFGDAISEAFGF